jgi:hypothetical protein
MVTEHGLCYGRSSSLHVNMNFELKHVGKLITVTCGAG